MDAVQEVKVINFVYALESNILSSLTNFFVSDLKGSKQTTLVRVWPAFPPFQNQRRRQNVETSRPMRSTETHLPHMTPT